MPSEPQTTESDRPTLSIVEGTGNPSDAAGPEVRTQETSPTGTARKTRKDGRLRAGLEGDRGGAITADDGIVISAERAALLWKALDEFRANLICLVQESAPASAESPKTSFGWNSLFGSVLRTTTSRSVFGRELTREELVGQYASLYPVLERPLNLAYAETALFGILALKSGRLAIAQTVLEEVRFCTLTSAALVYVMRGIMRFTWAMVFLVFASWYTWNLFAVFKDVWFDQSAFNGLKIGEEVAKVALAGFFGCLGAIVSLLMRLAEFDKTRGKSKEFLLLSGGTQPLVGGVFAAVIAALIISEIVTVSGISHSPKLWLFVVVGFISGFSERFTRSMLSVAENRFAPGPSQHDRKVTNGSRRPVL
jgi:hypothetical protein